MREVVIDERSGNVERKYCVSKLISDKSSGCCLRKFAYWLCGSEFGGDIGRVMKVEGEEFVELLKKFKDLGGKTAEKDRKRAFYIF